MTRAEALAWAADAFDCRTRTLAELASGDLSLAALLDRASSDPLVGRIRVLPAVEALPGWGKVECRRTLGSCGIDEDTRLDEVDAARLLDAFGAAS